MKDENMVKEEVSNDLMNLPIIINEKTKQVWLKRREREELSLIIKKIENKTALVVGDEKDDKGKPIHTNALKRDEETKTRLEANGDYTLKTAAVEELKDEIDDLTITLEFLNNRLRSARAMALIIGGGVV